MSTVFDDMASDIDAAPTAGQAAAAPVTLYRENCGKCGGSGKYRAPSSMGNVCFKCGGAGFHEYKTSPEYRREQRQKAGARKAKKADDKAQAWRDANPEAAAWIATRAAGGNGFACDLASSLLKWGSLTAGQLGAVMRCIEQDKVRDHQRAEAKKAAPVVDSTALESAFAKAKASGLKWPKIKLGGVVVSPAGANSQNAGALYVKQDGVYLGKIAGGRFMRSRDCGDEQAGKIGELIADPAGTAKAYGLATGECCICSRELTDKESIARGIGPICAERMGF